MTYKTRCRIRHAWHKLYIFVFIEFLLFILDVLLWKCNTVFAVQMWNIKNPMGIMGHNVGQRVPLSSWHCNQPPQSPAGRKDTSKGGEERGEGRGESVFNCIKEGHNHHTMSLINLYLLAVAVEVETWLKQSSCLRHGWHLSLSLSPQEPFLVTWD